MSSDKEHPVGDERSRKCDKCGKRDAVIHQVVVENGNVYEWHLCMECAAVEGFGADTVSGRRDSEMVVLSSQVLILSACSLVLTLLLMLELLYVECLLLMCIVDMQV
jgi:hypothetical protein